MGTICTKGIMFIMAPLITRWISSSEYGTFDLITEYATLLIPILTLATGEAVFRFLLEHCDDVGIENNKIVSTLFAYNMAIVLLIIIVAAVFSWIIPANIPVIYSFCFYLIGELLYQFIMMAMRGKKKLNVYTTSNVLYVLCLAAFVTLFVLILRLGLPGLLLGYGCGYYLSVIYMLFQSKIYNEMHIRDIDINVFKSAVKYALPMIPNSVSWWIINVSDRTIITFILGAGFNATYAIANKIPSLCQTLFKTFHLSWQQSATETLRDTDRDQYYSSVMNNMVRITGSVCILVLGLNYWFFKILYTEEYFSGYYQAPILVVAIIFSMLAQFIGSIYVARMESKINGATTMLAGGVNVLINLLFVKTIGLYAASISTMCAYIILFVIRYFDIKKKMDLKITKGSTFIMMGVLYFTISSYIEYGALRWINLALALATFAFLNANYIKIVTVELGRRLKMFSNRNPRGGVNDTLIFDLGSMSKIQFTTACFPATK